MKRGVWAAAGTAVLVVVGAAGYLVGESSAPTESQAQDAERAAYDQAFKVTEKQAATQAKEAALAGGRKDGRKAGAEDGASEADAEIAASQPAASSDGCPPGTDSFGTPPACIAQPAPGVSPEYDNCVAQGGTPSPGGCLMAGPRQARSPQYLDASS
jgi:hypothetical protein